MLVFVDMHANCHISACHTKGMEIETGSPLYDKQTYRVSRVSYDFSFLSVFMTLK